jgi:transcriptional regulator with XRE-family HTH domain
MASGDFGMRLKRARKDRGLTQEELAKLSGVAQTTISDLEKGESKSPVGTNLVALAQSLKVNPDWLATGKGNMDLAPPSTDKPLPPKAVLLAREWLKLDPEVQESVYDMVCKMVKTSKADEEPARDERVAESYGKPGRPRTRK